MVKTVIVIQARMGSVRLPGKVLRLLAGKPMLQYLTERLEHGRPDWPLVIATSDTAGDAALAAFAEQHGYACYRGSQHNVARRFLDVVAQFPADRHVRLCGDSPFFDTTLMAELAGLMDQDRRAVLATNTHPRSFPKGQSVEILRPDVYRAAYGHFNLPDDFEHVTHYFYHHAEEYPLVNLGCTPSCAHWSLAVDTADDWRRAERIVAAMDRPHWTYQWGEVLRLAYPGEAP